MTIGELAALLKISRSTAFRLKKLESWPHVRLGTEIRFSRQDYEAIVQMNHKTPPPPRTVPNVGTRAARRKQ